MALSAEQQRQFDEHGFIVVRRAFARADALKMQAEWWAELREVHGIDRDDRSTWKPERGDLRRPKTAPSQMRIETPIVRAVIDGLLGEGRWRTPRDWGRAIVTFPSGAPPTAWDVPPRIWHWDGLSAWNIERLASLFVVAFVGEVETAGGGTLVLGGSHRLVLAQYRAAVASGCAGDETARRDALSAGHPWLAALTGHAQSPKNRIVAFMGEGATVDGAPLKVVELTGAPGDMVFCHPLLMHAVAPNCRDVPRMMRIKQQLMNDEGRRHLRDAMAARFVKA
jgi:hypothetical protein